MKHLKLIIISLLILLLNGCAFDDPRYIHLSSKPNDYYYSSLLYKNLKNNESFSLKVFDSDFYKYYPVDDEDNDILISFFQSLNSDNYLTEVDINENPKYELSIQFDDEKYIINIYDENTVTLYPWDGSYSEDKISMSGVSPYNNLYSFCTYVINKSHQRENN